MALAGTMQILELTPALGDEIAVNGRIRIVFEHLISELPEGWRLGYRVYGAYDSALEPLRGARPAVGGYSLSAT